MRTNWIESHSEFVTIANKIFYHYDFNYVYIYLKERGRVYNIVVKLSSFLSSLLRKCFERYVYIYMCVVCVRVCIFNALKRRGLIILLYVARSTNETRDIITFINGKFFQTLDSSFRSFANHFILLRSRWSR